MNGLASFTAAALVAACAGAACAEDGRITVVGEGSTTSAPDLATIRVGVTTEAADAGAAIAANSERMAAVLARLEAAGIAARDLQTSDFTVQPRWEQQPGREQAEVTGYMARNLLTVRVRELARLGAILNEVALDGANAFEGLSFGLQDPRPAEDAARRAAVEDARARADLYARAAGVGLGPLLELSETVHMPGPLMMEAAAARMSADQAVPIAGGEVASQVQVTLVYAIVE